MKKLSKSEFADALQKGKGSVYLHVKNHGDADIKPELLNATLHAIGYDPQLEGCRSQWMMNLLSMTENPDYYCQAIFANYLDNTELWDVSQQSGMLAILAKNNYPGARDLLYQKFALQQFDENWLIAHEIIMLDGMKGMFYVANIIGQKMRSSSDIYETLMDTACEFLSKETTIQELQKAAKTNDNIAAYLEHIQRIETSHPSSKSTDPSFHEFLSFMETMPNKATRGYCRKLARKSTQEDIQGVFENMLLETRDNQLLRYGWFFEVAPMPHVSPNLLKLVESDDEELRHTFTRALSLVTDQSIRSLALNLWEQGKREGLRLLVNNFNPDDWQMITEKISKLPADQEIVHHCCLDLIQILSKIQEENPPVHILLWIYENSPCVECRYSAVQDLLEMDKLPQSLREECKYDCHEEIRTQFT